MKFLIYTYAMRNHFITTTLFNNTKHREMYTVHEYLRD